MADGRHKEDRWVLASGNPGKAREFESLLAPMGISIVMQNSLGIGEAEEPHPTFVENALAKARHACAGSGLVALADDSGICVPRLGGAPGVRSARYCDPLAGTTRDQVDEANNRKLVLQAAPLGSRVECFYYCVIVLMRHAQDPRPLIAEGVWRGELVASPRGSHGFGYDPHFLPEGQAVTAAEMEPGRKNQLSHRARAMAGLMTALASDAVPASQAAQVSDAAQAERAAQAASVAQASGALRERKGAATSPREPG